MRISTKGRHAVMAMIDLALNSKDRPVSLAGIASRQGISLSYLEQLVSCLKRYGLVNSARGPGGGYTLRLPSGVITISDVVGAVDNPARCCQSIAAPAVNGRDLTEVLWQKIDATVADYLKSVTLSDACAYSASDTEMQLDSLEFITEELSLPMSSPYVPLSEVA